MCSKNQKALGNAFQIIECTRTILKTGLPERCPQCDIQSCRQALARFLVAKERSGGRQR